MSTNFRLFGPVHLLILASVPAIAMVFSMASRQGQPSARWIRYGLGTFLALNEVVWYGYKLHFEGFRFPEGLPLQLCDLALWLTVFSLFTLRPLAFEIAYFAGLGGSGMALLTPDLWAPLASYPTIYFFLAHGMIVVCILMLLWSKQAKLRRGSVIRVFCVLNAYTTAIAIFDSIFKTNYMYLCRKPPGASILDLLGPWPFYVIWGEVVALIVFWLLSLPVRGCLSHFWIASPDRTAGKASRGPSTGAGRATPSDLELTSPARRRFASSLTSPVQALFRRTRARSLGPR